MSKQHPFKTLAYVVLPEHSHWLWRLPVDDCNYIKRWQDIKKGFTRLLLNQGVPLIKDKHGGYKLWQRRYWEHTIQDERDLEHHFNYIHYNPVKHGLVNRVQDWPHSSFFYYVQQGMMGLDWAGSGDLSFETGYGELPIPFG